MRRRGGYARGLALVVALAATAALLSGYAMPQHYNWIEFDGGAQHSGNDAREWRITPANVGGLHKLFQVTLPHHADSAPAVVTGVATPSGTHDLVFVTTTDGRIIALDAHTGAQVWAHQYGPAGCTINNGSNPCYTTSSPAVDPSLQYVYSYGLDGYVHKYAIGTGTETTTGGWPELATTKAYDEKGSAALTVVTTNSGLHELYVANGGYPGDNGDYQGHITAINLDTGAQQVFNTLCSNQTVHFVETPGTPDCPDVQSAVWARSGVVYDPATDRIYLVTGNGTYAPGQHDWGDSVLALHPDGTGSNGNPLDAYTPANYQQLQDDDLDLGSTAPAILPAPAGCADQHIAVQGGKDSILRLLNLDNLSGQGGPGYTGGELFTMNVPQGDMVFTAPAVWVDQSGAMAPLAFSPRRRAFAMPQPATWVFVATGSGISGLRLACSSGGTPSLTTVWQDSTGGTSPVIAGGVLFYATSNEILALDPHTGVLLWHDTSIGSIHWESPVVANGIVYITDETNHLTAYSL